LSKFAGLYEDWKKLISDYGVSWRGRSADDLVIDRLTSVEDPEEIWNWIVTVKQERPELAELLDLMAVSGLRFVEGVNSFNIISELSKDGKLVLDRVGKDYRSGYYNRDLESLEHFWFRETFIRPTKKAFVSFVPEQLITRIGKLDVLASADAVKKLVQKRRLRLRFGDIREAHGTFMTRYLKENEIDFLHGRVTGKVFMANYFNPALIADLKTRAFKGIAEIMGKVKA
jgi:intergrase/recombinase